MINWTRLLLISCATLLALAFAGPSGALAARQGAQGLQGGWAIDNAGGADFVHSVTNQYRFMQAAGAGWVRINFRLGDCYQDWTTRSRCNGKTALEAYDQVVQRALDHNLKIVGLFSNESWHGGQGEWTANNAENNPGRTGDNAYFKAFAERAVRIVVSRYRTRITQWEMWNEPNAWTYLDGRGNPAGGSFIYPSNFAWLLKRAHLEVRAAQPSGRVISGGLFGHDIGGQTVSAAEQAVRIGQVGPEQPADGGWVTKQGTLKGTRLERRLSDALGPEEAAAAAACETIPSGGDYLCSTYDMGRAKAGWDAYRRQRGSYPLDHVGQHLYIDQGGPTNGAKIRRYLDDLRRAYVRYEGVGSAKRTMLTEFGWQTAPGHVTAPIQARNLQVAYATFRATSYVGRAFWFNAQDIPEGNLPYGLVDTDGAGKPAMEAYRLHATY